MRSFKLLALLVLFTSRLSAQIIADPTTWKFQAKKLNGDEYEAQINCKIKEGWHLWSIDPGGDGLLRTRR